MTRQELDKENLLRDATALVERIELRWSNEQREVSTVVAGFRHDGAASVFFDADPVYHFNAVGELRRAYRAGLLLKAEGHRLVSMRRSRSTAEVALLRHELTDEEQTATLDAVATDLAKLAMAIESTSLKIVGQVPADKEVLGRLRNWLQHLGPVRVAEAPNATRCVT